MCGKFVLVRMIGTKVFSKPDNSDLSPFGRSLDLKSPITSMYDFRTNGLHATLGLTNVCYQANIIKDIATAFIEAEL
jgi:hypothetical protein